MIPAALGIVFNRENTGLRPELAMADRLHDAAERQIVIRHHRLRCRRATARSAGMIVRQTNNNELRKLALLFELLQLPNELIGANRIRDSQAPSHVIGGEMRPQGFNRRTTPKSNLAALVGEIPIKIQELRNAFASGIVPARFRNGKFTIVTE